MMLKELLTIKKTFAVNLLTPMSSKMSMSFFLQSKRHSGFCWKHSRIFSI